jgi:predicted RNase H-like HicB family nuclease
MTRAVQGELVSRMKDSARYVKIVERSDEDGCFVGQCPGIIGPCCYGDDEAQVYSELCKIVDEWIETLRRDCNPLPPPTSGKNVAEEILSA